MQPADFWAKGVQSDDCILWPASTNQGGYGHVWVGGKLKQTHRYAYELEHGPIPDGMCVLHVCDVRRCYNPAHLWLGTRKDNNTDRSVKNRTARLHGERNPNARLTNEQAEQIRRRYDRTNREELMREYGISRSAFYKALGGRTYQCR